MNKILDLDDMEHNERVKMNEKISQKFIRNTGNKGGMLNYENMYNSEKRQPRTSLDIEQHPSEQYPFEQRQPQFYNERTEPEEEFRYPKHMHYSCVDIANHTKHCPVCSRLYYNDKNLYVVIIGILIILCILLAKKCMEK